MPRQRLVAMEIDEVSLVDRAANQHSTVAIAKRDSGDTMPKFVDHEGNPVDESDVRPGDWVYDAETGKEFRGYSEEELEDMAAQGLFDSDEEQDELEDAQELAAIGKADWGRAVNDFATSSNKVERVGAMARKARLKGMEGSMRTRAAVGKRPIAAVAGAGAVGAAGGNMKGRMSKRDEGGLGQYVLSELSKAHADDRVTAVVGEIAKAYDEVRGENEQLTAALTALIEKSDHDAYTDVAAGFGLPYDARELGGLLQRLSYAGVDEGDLEALGGLLAQAGTMSKALEEIGSAGDLESGSVHGEIEGYVQSLVGKSDMSYEQATAEVYGANPAAYDAYLAEQRV